MLKDLRDIQSNIGMPPNLPTSIKDLEQIWRNKDNKENFIDQLRTTSKYLRNICLKGEKSLIRREIKEAIDERCLNLQKNQ